MIAADIVELIGRRPRLLALGEPTHGAEALLQLRNELFRHLVERAGYRTIALETDCLAGLVVNDHVTAGAGTLDDVMARGFSHEWGAFAGNRELVRWMRAHNDGRPAGEQVRFAGFDGPLEITAGASPRPVLAALHAFLAARVGPELLPAPAETIDRLIGADDHWTNPAAMMDPAQSVGRTAEARELRLLADDLAALLEAQTPHLVATSTPDEWFRARLAARTATGLLRYHFWMADRSPGRLAWLLAVRDSMMAANLLALTDRGPTLAYGHNAHFQRARSSMRMGGEPVHWWSGGAIAGARLGPEYAVVATAVGTIRSHGVDVPPPGTVEGELYARPGNAFVVRPADVRGATARTSPWFGYAPIDPGQLVDLDGIVFVKAVDVSAGR